MGPIIFGGLFGLAIAASVVQITVARRTSFCFRTAAISGGLAIIFVALVAIVVGYFLARVRINDHYEVNSTFMAVVVVAPATIGAFIGAVGGTLIAHYTAVDRR